MEDVAKIGEKLDNIMKGTISDIQAMDLLNALSKCRMTLEILQKTRIGMTVNNFRKHVKDESVISLSKALIKKWKLLLPDGSNQSGGSEPSLKHSNSTSSLCSTSFVSTDSSDLPGSRLDDVVPSSSKNNSGIDGIQTKKAVSDKALLKKPVTTDAVRLKCIALILAALTSQPVPEGSQEPQKVAEDIEAEIFLEFKNTDMKYKNKIRSRILNLKDSRNPKLRENVLLGLIEAERLAKMTPEEMASDDLRALRAKLTKEAINDHQMAVNEGTKTTLLKCGKCQQRSCTYTQIQTRSADEPMTTFVLCNNCGNRWKFN